MSIPIGPCRNVTCTKCGWISFSVSKAYAEQQVNEFLAYWDSLTPEQRENCGWTERKGHHYRCLKCGGDQFRPSTAAEMNKISGSTVNPVIYEEG